MRQTLLVCMILFAAAFSHFDEARADDQDDAILTKALMLKSKVEGVTAVAPMTYVYGQDSKDLASTRKYIKERFPVANYDIARLFDTLMEKNRISVRLTLPSSPEKGFIIDYDGTFKKYFEKGGGGWEQWHKDNPTLRGHTTVSLPAYDPETGFVLLYIATQSEPLSGSGYILLYKYSEGNLREISRAMLWVS